jgi:hypothetical protein
MENSTRQKINLNSFLERAIAIHDNKYDYSKAVIVNTKVKIEIQCPSHGLFLQAPANHLSGQGCPICAQLSRTKTQRFSTRDFVEIAKNIHHHKYDYKLVEYLNSQTKVTIICQIHGEFLMKPNSHCNGQGCPKCGRKIAK